MTVPSKSNVNRLCDLDLWPMKVKFFWWIDYDPISVLYEFQIDISINSREIKYQNMGIGLLHVKRHTRQKWRPMVTKFGTLIREYEYWRGCMTAIFFYLFFDDFMRNSNFGIGVLHVKVKILTYFLWRHFSARSSFYFIE